MMDYPRGKFRDCTFSRFGSISCGQTHRHADAQTDADERFTPAIIVGVSSNKWTQSSLFRNYLLFISRYLFRKFSRYWPVYYVYLRSM